MESISIQHKDRLTAIATQAAEALGLVILRITARGVPSRPVIEVTLDGPRLIRVDDCEIVSKKLNEAIESEKLTGGNYRLDVLSPGLDEPVMYDYQFQRTIGHLIEVKAQDGHSIMGILKEFSTEEIIISKRQKKKNADDEMIHIKREEVESVYARADFG